MEEEQSIKPSEARICAKCIALTATVDGLRMACSDQGYLHWSSKHELRESARSCRLCNMVWESRSWRSTQVTGPLRIFVQQNTSQNSDSSKFICDEHPLKGVTFQLLVIKGEPSQHSKSLVRLYVSASRNDPSFPLVNKEPVLTEVGSPSAFDHVRRWLHACRNLHTMCSGSVSSIMPTRLLDVGLDTLTSSVCLKSMKTVKCDYIALSYCWGTSCQPVTTKDNLDSRQMRLDLSMLPQTIRDAVIVTRNLGVQFLWVDALCIVQDDHEERMNEIKAMGTIYKNALLTISAASTSSVFDGFLHDRTNSGLLDVPFWMSPHSQGTIKLAKWQYVHQLDEPLHCRGWTFQEYVLSPRRLLFCRHEILWTCATHQLVPARDSHLSYGNDIGLNFQHFNQGIVSGKKRAKIWHAVVETYSGRKFSDPADKLNALAGIVTELSVIWRDTYLFGLWSSTLVQDLAWHRQPKQDTVTERHTFALPSWSWCSTDFAVQIWPVMSIVDAQPLDATQISQSLTTINDISEQNIKISLCARCLDALKITTTEGRLFQSITMDDGSDLLPPNSFVALLGYKKDKDSKKDSALCLVLHQLECGIFERIGYTRTWDFPWADVTPGKFILV